MIYNLKNKKRSDAFTLAEILMVLMIIGAIATMTIPSLVRNINEAAAVSGAKNTYSILANATKLWQNDEDCIGDVSQCLGNYSGLDTKNAFKGIEKYLKIKEKFCGRDGSLENIDWLPEYTTLLNGWKQDYAWEGVSKVSSYQEGSCYYLLENGVSFRLEFPDNNRKSAFGLLDINNKKPPNRVGKDTFPIAWGAAGNVGWESKSFNPYWAEDQWMNSATKPDGSACTQDDMNKRVPGCEISWSGTGPTYKGLCRISCYGCKCAPDVHSPTAYVMQYGKLPDLKAAGYPE